MSTIYRRIDANNTSNDTKRCNIKIHDSYIYNDINNIDKNQQKTPVNNKIFTRIDSLNLKILVISFILLSSLLLGISLFLKYTNIIKFDIILNIICIIIIPLLLLLSQYFINIYHASQYNTKYNAMIEDDKQELLKLFNDYVVDASTNTVMKNYQLINLNKSTKNNIHLDITNDYHFTNEICSISYIKKLEKTERDAIERHASKIPDFSEEDLQRFLKMISSLDNIRKQKKVVKYNEKYSINSDIYKQKLNDYNEIIDNLTREFEEVSRKINKLNS